jgi:predicted DNA-binding transcriptional regulator AlpA
MTREEVLRLACIAPSTLYAWIADGHFPASISLGPHRANGFAGKAVWLREEIQNWAREQVAKSRSPAKFACGASQPA